MTDKKSTWRLDNYPVEALKLKIDELISFLGSTRSVLTFRSPPGELVLQCLEEVLIYCTTFFAAEHFDILRVNPSLKIVYSKTSFRGSEGQIEIDTGLPKSIREYASKPRIRVEELISQFIGDFLQDIIELKQAYLNDEPLPLYERVRPKSRFTRPRLSIAKERKLRKEIFNLQAQVAFWRRRYKFLRHSLSPRKKS